MSAGRPPDEKRRRERTATIIEAAASLLDEGGIEALTTRGLSEHSGIPIPTIYRYFADRDAIILAFLDREYRDLNSRVAKAVLGLAHVNIENTIRASAMTHMRYHEEHPLAVEIWFGGGQSTAVYSHCRRYDATIAGVWNDSFRAANMIVDETPDFLFELMTTWQDRMWEFAFAKDRLHDERQAIVATYIDTVVAMVHKYATPRGITGIPLAEFLLAVQADSAVAE